MVLGGYQPEQRANPVARHTSIAQLILLKQVAGRPQDRADIERLKALLPE